MIKLKRIYEPPADDDGQRILVDRLWPRGVAKASARIDLWLKEIAPSNDLRSWFGHEPARWEEFRDRYREELAGREQELGQLRDMVRSGTVTLLFAAHDEEHNNAVVLRELLEEMLAAS